MNLHAIAPSSPEWLNRLVNGWDEYYMHGDLGLRYHQSTDVLEYRGGGIGWTALSMDARARYTRRGRNIPFALGRVLFLP